jgi:dTDP-4-dehydrorhamnose 3,5-epimerase
MRVRKTRINGLLVIEPEIFGDSRGFFMETYNQARYMKAGVSERFVQDNLSLSSRGVLRGLHFQNPAAQGKLVYVLEGEVFDVAVDIRKGSPTFGLWHGEVISSENRLQFWIPPGFAHGFCVLSEQALFTYKCTEFYAPEHECSIRWDDPFINIDWPCSEPILSEKDKNAPFLKDVSEDKLFILGDLD